VMTLLGELRVDESPVIRRAATWLQRGLILRYASLEAQQ
jgi:hypothetical protein